MREVLGAETMPVETHVLGRLSLVSVVQREPENKSQVNKNIQATL